MAKTPCPMTAIPLDMVGIILDDLELADVKSIRLTCKYLSTIGPRFKHFISQQTTDLGVESLQRQRELASHPQLRSVVTELVVMAAVFDASELDRMLKTKRRRIVEVKGPFTTTTEPGLTDDELLQAASDLEWMHAQQTRQRIQTLPESIDALATVLRLYGALDTIDVDACVTKSPRIRVSTAQAGEWHPVYIRASEVYQITTSAICLSGVLLKSLLIYRETPSCSLPQCYGECYLIGSNAGQYSHEDFEVSTDENFPGIVHMLRRMPKLDAFDLHMTNTLDGPSMVYGKIFDHIADRVKLPMLTQVFFRGMPASEKSLLKFIDNHQSISDLTIDEMKLKSGSWKRAIKHISQLPDLSKLHLSNLFDEQGVFNLLSKTLGDDEQPRKNPQNSYSCLRGVKIHTRAFGSAEIQLLRAGLEFDDTDIGRGLGSPQFMRWGQIRRFKYSV
ncbi:hypothetical protein IFR05_007649 [Cadophora sp. M221]|nr:hypothetical protein IFR05_007649 [Cadophora sp. M221]